MRMNISIEQLKRDWKKMHRLDAARAVAHLKKSGISIRQIAKQVGCSASLLGHLLSALKAPAADILLARKGEISINELARRAKAELARREVSRQEIEKEKRSQTADKAAATICKWLQQTDLNRPSCETIVDNVRRDLADREQKHALPALPPKIKLAVHEIIQRMKPPEMKPDDNFSIDGWYQIWLLRWVFWAFPDSDIRSTALDLALERQWRR